jgi:hypothetical protein
MPTSKISNFKYGHRCIVVPDVALEIEDHPSFGDTFTNDRNHPAREIDLDGKEFLTYTIVFSRGYYRDGCLTAFPTDSGDIYDDFTSMHSLDIETPERLAELVWEWSSSIYLGTPEVKRESLKIITDAISAIGYDPEKIMREYLIPHFREVELKQIDNILDAFRDIYGYIELRTIGYAPNGEALYKEVRT